MGKTGSFRSGNGDNSGMDFACAQGEGDSFILTVANGLTKALAAAGISSADKGGLARAKMLLAFSGGPDSTALFAALVKLRDKAGFTLAACHVNHQTRGKESLADEALCKQMAASHGIQLLVKRVDSGCRKSEDHWRQARYKLLGQAADEAGCQYVLTGHTLDDQVETILFRLFRGTGPAGLTGMNWARLLQDNIYLLRPLLSARRSDCLSFLQKCRINAANDSSNDNLAYARNYIRHAIVPMVSERFPDFQWRLETLRAIIDEDEHFLDSLTDNSLAELSSQPFCNDNCWPANMFASLPHSLKRRLVVKAMANRGIEVSFARVEQALLATSGGPALTLNERWQLRSTNGYVYWSKGDGVDSLTTQANAPITVRIPGLTIAPGLTKALRIEVWQHDNETKSDKKVEPATANSDSLVFPPAHAGWALVDLSQLCGPLVLRFRQPGDLIRPFGLGKLVRLKKFLHNIKLPSHLRRVLVLADRDEVLWIPGVALSDKIKVREQPTHRLLWLDIKPDASELC